MRDLEICDITVYGDRNILDLWILRYYDIKVYGDHDIIEIYKLRHYDIKVYGDHDIIGVCNHYSKLNCKFVGGWDLHGLTILSCHYVYIIWELIIA